MIDMIKFFYAKVLFLKTDSWFKKYKHCCFDLDQNKWTIHL